MELPVDYTKLTPQERRAVRMEYIKQQNNLCMHIVMLYYGNMRVDNPQNQKIGG